MSDSKKKFPGRELNIGFGSEDKIAINHEYVAPMTMLYNEFTEDMSESDKKEFTRSHKALAKQTYERLKADLENDGDIDSFIFNISSNTKDVIRICYNDSELIKSLDLPEIRQLTIQCFCHEGHTVPKVRARMKTIVKFFPYYFFSDEILEEFKYDIDLEKKKEKEDKFRNYLLEIQRQNRQE